MYAFPDVSEIVALALAEDLGVPVETFVPVGKAQPARDGSGKTVLARDITTDAVPPAHASFSGVVVAREPLVVAGLPVAERVWSTLARAGGLPGSTEVFPLVAEGASVAAGTRLAEVSGPARVVLAGERTALNFLMVLSGIATETARWVHEAGPDLAVCDTRKTYPGLRALSKYAVRVGGGTNHRTGLWDMVLVKDNHIAAAGDVALAVTAARAANPDKRVEVEADSAGAAREAALSGADMVLLDNMSDDELRLAVRAARDAAAESGRAIVAEASGGIDFERLAALRASGVDRVSTSALTLARPVDVALDEA